VGLTARRHPGRLFYVTPTGWRARCQACGWEQGRYHDQSEAIGGFLEHAALAHGYITPDDVGDSDHV